MNSFRGVVTKVTLRCPSDPYTYFFPLFGYQYADFAQTQSASRAMAF